MKILYNASTLLEVKNIFIELWEYIWHTVFENIYNLLQNLSAPHFVRKKGLQHVTLHLIIIVTLCLLW